MQTTRTMNSEKKVSIRTKAKLCALGYGWSIAIKN